MSLPAAAPVLTLAVLSLAGCGERKAEVQTPTGTAEVTTTLPENQVPDAQLEVEAAKAAVAVSQPGNNTVLPDGVDREEDLIPVAR